MVSELFLIDAEQCNGALQRFADGQRSPSVAATAEAARGLADVMVTLALAGDADCARRLARHLAQPVDAAQLALLRRHAGALAQRLAGVVQALRSQTAPPDGTAFAAAWLAGLPPLPQADTDAAADAPLQPAPSAAPLPAAAPLRPAARATELADAQAADGVQDAERRRALLDQARRLHESLPSADAAVRTGLERVIADLLTQACQPARSPHLPDASAPVLLSAESCRLFQAALAALPAAAACSARTQAGVVVVDVGLADPGDALGARLLALLVEGGGWLARLPTGLRLSLPRDHDRPEIRVLHDARGAFAVPALQAGAWAVLPAAAAAPTVRAWRYRLPVRPAWPRPADWLGLVSGHDGRLLPLRAPPAGVMPWRG